MYPVKRTVLLVLTTVMLSAITAAVVQQATVV